MGAFDQHKMYMKICDGCKIAIRKYVYSILTHSLPNSTMADLLIMFKIASVDSGRSKYVCAQLR
jgi:hypothetical protein